MSFRCDKCNCAQPTHTKPIVEVTETRPRKYYEHGAFTGEGQEIVEELALCEECAEREDDGI